jgi:hypothetical protein
MNEFHVQGENQLFLFLQESYREILSKCYNDYIHHVEQELLSITKSFLTLCLCSQCQKTFYEKTQQHIEKERNNISARKTSPTHTNDFDNYLKKKHASQSKTTDNSICVTKNHNHLLMHTAKTTVNRDKELPFKEQTIVTESYKKKTRYQSLLTDQQNEGVNNKGWFVRKENITKEWNDALNIEANTDAFFSGNTDHTTNIQHTAEENCQNVPEFSFTHSTPLPHTCRSAQHLKEPNPPKKNIVCNQCNAFYNALNLRVDHDEISSFSKHKSFHQISSTPLGFWDVEFPKTPPTSEDSI